MKHLVLGLLLTLWAGTALAQAPGLPAPAAPLRSTFSVGKQDTMRALGNMFERRRRAGKIWLGVGAAGGLAALRVATITPKPSSPYAPPPHDNSAAAAIVGAVVGGIPLIIGIAKLAGASQRTEDDVVYDYAHGGKVPWGVAHHLRHRDFD